MTKTTKGKSELQVWLVRWTDDGALLVYGVTEDIDLVEAVYEKTLDHKWSDRRTVLEKLVRIGIPTKNDPE